MDKICVLIGLLLTEFPDLEIVDVRKDSFFWIGERHKEGKQYLMRKGSWLAGEILAKAVKI